MTWRVNTAEALDRRRDSTRRPIERPAAEQVKVQMIDRLAGIGTAIGDDPIPALEAKASSQVSQYEQHVASQFGVGVVQFAQRGDRPFRN
jgi:hypothetical protein